MNDGPLDVVVAGAGRVGLRTAELLDDYGHSVTVIEADSQRCDVVADEYVATLIHGDASQPDVLRQAHIGRQDVVAALTGDGGRNLGICYAAKHVAEGDIRTVARVDVEGEESYAEIVDEVVFPEKLGALAATNAVVGSDVRAIEDVVGDLRIVEIRVREGAPVAGKRLEQVAFPSGSTVISDADNDHIAGAEMVLTPGRTYLVATEPGVADEVVNLMQG